MDEDNEPLGSRPLKQCRFCERTFSKMEHLRRHQRTHTGEKPFRCTKCERSYARSDVLARHLRSHHPLPANRRGRQSRVTQSTRPVKENVVATSDLPNNLTERNPATVVSDNPSILQAHEPTSGHDSASLPTTQTFEHAGLDGVEPHGRPSHLDRTRHQQTDHVHEILSGFQPDTLNTILGVAFETSNDEARAYDLTHSPAVEQTYDQQPNLNWLDNVASGPIGDFEVPFGHLAFTPFQMLDEQNTVGFDAVGDAHNSNESAPAFIADASHNPNGSVKAPPDDRYVKVARFWPQKNSLQLPYSAYQMWRDLVRHRSDEESSCSGSRTAYTSISNQNSTRSRSEYGFDDTSYQRLVDEFSCVLSTAEGNSFDPINGSYELNLCESPGYRRSFISTVSTRISFPPRDVLEVSVGLYFRRFHALFPLIHEPTFRVSETSTSLLFTICLIGLCYLGDASAKRFVHLVAPGTMMKINGEIASIGRRSTRSSIIIAYLSSSALFMCLATILSEFTDNANIKDLYMETLTIAQRLGFFTASGDDVLRRLDDEIETDINNEDLWQIWARVESAKRLIVGLIMCDAYYAHALDIYPVIRSDFVSYYLPSSRDLFEAAGSARWKTVQGAGPFLSTPLFHLRRGQAVIPPSLSPFAMHAILSSIWICMSEVKQQQLENRRSPEELSLLDSCHLEADGGAMSDVGMMLLKFHGALNAMSTAVNPNILAAWHNLCMSLTADRQLFELAVGRAGPQQARAAQGQVATWARTAGARRASLHAAQTFAVMSRRTTSDGTNFHSEIALFASALVLGLFISASPECVEQADHLGQTQDSEPFELLDDVHWDAVGSEGFSSTAAQQHTFPRAENHPETKCAARDFIRYGGQVSFGGKIYSGGFDAAQRIFLEYAGLLEEVGRWNVRRYCHILRLMSDLNMSTTPAAGG